MKDFEEWEIEIDNKVDAWHNGNSKLSLEEYLGMSDLEFKLFLHKPYQYWNTYIRPQLYSR